jgi:hypothetical protein
VVTTLEVGSPGVPLGGFGDVVVTTTEALTVGSTDLAVSFDPEVLRAVSASSTLSSFTFSIDNTAGRVTTASASAAGDVLAGGDSLLTVRFTPVPGTAQGATTEVTLSDVDGRGCNDLSGPVPQIPPGRCHDRSREPFIWRLGTWTATAG